MRSESFSNENGSGFFLFIEQLHAYKQKNLGV